MRGGKGRAVDKALVLPDLDRHQASKGSQARDPAEKSLPPDAGQGRTTVCRDLAARPRPYSPPTHGWKPLFQDATFGGTVSVLAGSPSAGTSSMKPARSGGGCGSLVSGADLFSEPWQVRHDADELKIAEPSPYPDDRMPVKLPAFGVIRASESPSTMASDGAGRTATSQSKSTAADGHAMVHSEDDSGSSSGFSDISTPPESARQPRDASAVVAGSSEAVASFARPCSAEQINRGNSRSGTASSKGAFSDVSGYSAWIPRKRAAVPSYGSWSVGAVGSAAVAPAGQATDVDQHSQSPDESRDSSECSALSDVSDD